MKNKLSLAVSARTLPRGGRVGEHRDRGQDSHLVCDAGQAFVESAELAIRAGVDHALHPDGGGRVDGVDAARPSGARGALWFFGIQLVLNTLWSFVFFGAENPGLAMAEIVVLWAAIAATIWTFRRISTAAAWMLAPYLAWVSFASGLNFAIWRLN